MTRPALPRESEHVDALRDDEVNHFIRTRCVALLHQVGVKSTRKIADHDELMADLGLESIQVLRLIALVEREFELLIDTHELTAVKTMADLVEFVRVRSELSLSIPEAERAGQLDG